MADKIKRDTKVQVLTGYTTPDAEEGLITTALPEGCIVITAEANAYSQWRNFNFAQYTTSAFGIGLASGLRDKPCRLVVFTP